MNTETVTVSR